MPKSNTEKTLKNSLISVSAQVATLFLQFINRRIFIFFLDIEYLGYQSLFSNVFSILSVAEMGIGNIIAFHLYKEVALKNKDEIGKLMYLYKWLYRIVAIIVCLGGAICYFFLPFFVTDVVVDWNYLHVIYVLQLAGVVMGYFLSYKQVIFIATQQEYKCIQTVLYVDICIQVLQLATLAIFHNYIVYLCFYISKSVLVNVIMSWRANREFPFLQKKYSISKEYIKSRNMLVDLRDFLIHKISYAVYGSTDNIIISAYCGVRAVGIYGNYTMIQAGVLQVLFYKLLNPVQAAIGNIVYSERSKKDLWEQFEMLDVFSFFFASYIGVGFFLFYQPFIQLWMGKEYLLPDTFVALFSFTIYLGAAWEIVYKYRCVFGDYKQDRWLMLLSAVMNILISIPGAKHYGVVGVQLGTLIAYLPIAFGRVRFVIGNYFGQSIWKYFIKHICLAGVAAAEAGMCYLVTRNMVVSVIGMIGRVVVWAFIPLIINLFIYWRNPYFKQMLVYLNHMLKIVRSKVK